MMPWNLGAVVHAVSLRLAVELDCDARVLRERRGGHSYGDVLIDLAEHALPLRLTAVALADDSLTFTKGLLQ